MNQNQAQRSRKEFMRENRDCVRASVATVLSIPYDDVPAINPLTWQEDLNRWLYEKGFSTLNVVLKDDSAVVRGIHVGSIASNFGQDHQHCVVLKDGKVWFDPQLKDSQGRPPSQPEILEHTVIFPLDAGKLFVELSELRRKANELEAVEIQCEGQIKEIKTLQRKLQESEARANHAIQRFEEQAQANYGLFEKFKQYQRQCDDLRGELESERAARKRAESEVQRLREKPW